MRAGRFSTRDVFGRRIFSGDRVSRKFDGETFYGTVLSVDEHDFWDEFVATVVWDDPRLQAIEEGQIYLPHELSLVLLDRQAAL